MLKCEKPGIARVTQRRKSQLNGHSTGSAESNNLDQAAFKVLWRYALGLVGCRLSKALCVKIKWRKNETFSNYIIIIFYSTYRKC